MAVKRKAYTSSLENFKKLKKFIKKLNQKTDKNGRTKINR